MSNYELMKNKEAMSQLSKNYQEALKTVLTHQQKTGLSQRKACDETKTNYKRFTTAMTKLREAAGLKNAPPSSGMRRVNKKQRVSPKKPIKSKPAMQTFEVDTEVSEKPMVALIGKPSDVMETLKAVFS